MNEMDPNFGGIDTIIDERTKIEVAEHTVYSNLERLLNAGCVNICGEVHNWLGRELKKRVSGAAE